MAEEETTQVPPTITEEELKLLTDAKVHASVDGVPAQIIEQLVVTTELLKSDIYINLVTASAGIVAEYYKQLLETEIPEEIAGQMAVAYSQSLAMKPS